MKLPDLPSRVSRLLRRFLKRRSIDLRTIPDPRSSQGGPRPLLPILNLMLVGMLSARNSLRSVEALSERLIGKWGWLSGPDRRVSDTVLLELIQRLDPEPWAAILRAQVVEMKRTSEIDPEGLPCGVLAVDGKNLATLDYKATDAGQRHEQGGKVVYLMRAVRAVLTSARSKPCIAQRMIPAETNDMGVFADFFAQLLASFGASNLFEILTMDAGFTSLANARLVHDANYGFVLGVKGNQATLLAEMEEAFADERGRRPDARTGWEVRSGGHIRRTFWRQTKLPDAGEWEPLLRQAWCVLQETRVGDTITREYRYFVSNVPVGRLTASQCLAIVRGHWGIENDSNWSADVIWREDSGPWCCKGASVETLGLLRMIAYNLLQLVRKLYLPKPVVAGRRSAPTPWSELIDLIREAVALGALAPDNGPPLAPT